MWVVEERRKRDVEEVYILDASRTRAWVYVSAYLEEGMELRGWKFCRHNGGSLRIWKKRAHTFTIQNSVLEKNMAMLRNEEERDEGGGVLYPRLRTGDEHRLLLCDFGRGDHDIIVPRFRTDALFECVFWEKRDHAHMECMHGTLGLKSDVGVDGIAIKWEWGGICMWV
jgi:hypothetical protein